MPRNSVAGRTAFRSRERVEDGCHRGGRWRPGPVRRRGAPAATRVRGVSSLVEHRTRSHFLPVVILGVDPEDRDRRHLVVARDLLGELERRERLEQREQRAAEEARLLAGDDGDGAAVGEQARRLARARRAPVAAPAELAMTAAISVAAAIVRLRARDRVRPRGAIGRIAGKKRRDRSEVVGVVGGEPPDPRKAPNVDRDAHGIGSTGLRVDGVEVSAELTCTRTPTVSKRSRGLSSKPTSLFD